MISCSLQEIILPFSDGTEALSVLKPVGTANSHQFDLLRPVNENNLSIKSLMHHLTTLLLRSILQK